MSQKNTDRNTFNSPDWDEPLGTEELCKIKEEYGSLANDLKELAKLVKKADRIFQNCLLANQPGRLPEGQNAVIIHTKTARYVHYNNQYPQHSYDLEQSTDTYKQVLQILYSAITLKPDIERVIGITQAKDFFGKLETTLRFFKPAPDSVYNSGGDPIHVRYEEGKWLYVGNSTIDDQRQADDIIGELRDWQGRLQAKDKNSTPDNQNNNAYREIDLAERTLTIGDKPQFIASDPVWDLIKDLCADSKAGLTTKRKEGNCNRKNAVDMLRRKIGKTNHQLFIKSVRDGYILNSSVKIKYGSQVGIRRTTQKAY